MQSTATPNPSNLHTWGIAETPVNSIHSNQYTLEYIHRDTEALERDVKMRQDQVGKNIAEVNSATNWATSIYFLFNLRMTETAVTPEKYVPHFTPIDLYH